MSCLFQILRDEEQRSDYDYMLDNPGKTKECMLDLIDPSIDLFNG